MKEETKLLNKLLVCAYIIIALLAINTLIVFIANVDTSNNNSSDNTTTEEAETSEDYDVSMMDSVDMEGLLKLFDSKETQVVYLGRSTCGYCVKFLPTLQKAQSEYGYTTHYLDITTVSDDDVSNLLKKDNDDKFLEENYGSTPMVILVKGGKMVDTWVGYSEYDDFAQFLEKNGFEK